MRKKILKNILVVLSILCILTNSLSCSQLSKQEQVQKNFNSFMNSLFVREVQSDTLSLNYSLAHPEKYGISPAEATLGDYSIHRMKEDLAADENTLKHLLTFDYKLLDSNQQLTYQIVQNYLKEDIGFGDFTYYRECLGPTTGIQAQLPILLAEYTFYSKEDIDEYISLLGCVDKYFNDIIEYEREKSAHGLFMSDYVANRIISQCKSFISSPGDNFLISYFNEKICDFSGLTKEEQKAYQKKNEEAVLCHVIPAYQNLIDALTKLLGTGKNNAGLYYYPEGQDYYECLAKYKTGSAKSMDEMSDMLNKAINHGIANLSSLTLKDPDIIDKYLSFSSFPITNPNDILADLKTDIKKDFPDEVPVSCKIKYVPASLSDYLSPAMYLVPPIDNYKNNNIYINGNNKKTLSMIYTTVAHEGYPGHLYQCVYFRSKNPAPIRNVINFTGYDEGWATYVEMYSYHYAGIDENLADFLENNNIVILCMYARADIGIHYQGWSKQQVVDYISQYIGDKEISGAIYNTLLEEPAIYLPYAIGYLEIKELRAEAEKDLGNEFSAKKFHKFLLDTGPAQFGIIKNQMELWIADQRK